jgi:hypothetical protein
MVSKYFLQSEFSPLVTRRYFVTYKSHMILGQCGRERHFLHGSLSTGRWGTNTVCHEGLMQYVS